jgi:hypothetical protein
VKHSAGAPVLGRSLVWAVFILLVMASAALTVNASTRLLGPPDQPTACEGKINQRICADMLTRTAMNAQVLIPGTPLPCPGNDPSSPAPDTCQSATPTGNPVQPTGLDVIYREGDGSEFVFHCEPIDDTVATDTLFTEDQAEFEKLKASHCRASGPHK